MCGGRSLRSVVPGVISNTIVASSEGVVSIAGMVRENQEARGRWVTQPDIVTRIVDCGQTRAPPYSQCIITNVYK